jgi:hypothetical protein
MENSRFHALDSISHVTAGNVERFQLSVPGIPSQSYGLRIYNNGPSDLNLGALLLVGHSSPDSSATSQIVATLQEVREVVLRSAYNVYANTQVWTPIPVMPGDSIIGSLRLDPGLQAFIINSAEMADLTMNGNQAIGSWNSQNNARSIKLSIDQPDTLYYLVKNDSTANLGVSDTIRLVHKL